MWSAGKWKQNMDKKTGPVILTFDISESSFGQLDLATHITHDCQLFSDSGKGWHCVYHRTMPHDTHLAQRGKKRRKRTRQERNRKTETVIEKRKQRKSQRSSWREKETELAWRWGSRSQQTERAGMRELAVSCPGTGGGPKQNRTRERKRDREEKTKVQNGWWQRRPRKPEILSSDSWLRVHPGSAPIKMRNLNMTNYEKKGKWQGPSYVEIKRANENT